MPANLYLGINRTMCDVLEEMRKAYETRNFSYLPGLIEEIQSMGNRMEAALSDKKDLRDIRDNLPKLRQEYKKLALEVKSLRKQTKSEDE